MESPVWDKVKAFTDDSIINAFLSGQDKTFLSGWLYGMARLAAFKGEDEPEREARPEDMVPIQFGSEK